MGAINVVVGAKISLSSPIPSTFKLRSNELVPEFKAKQYFDLVISQIFFSNFDTNFPEVDTQPVFKHSVTYLISFGENFGSCKKIMLKLYDYKKHYY